MGQLAVQLTHSNACYKYILTHWFSLPFTRLLHYEPWVPEVCNDEHSSLKFRFTNKNAIAIDNVHEFVRIPLGNSH